MNRILFLLFLLLSGTQLLALDDFRVPNDTVIIGFNPNNCRNCLSPLPFLDSALKANNYFIQYYLFGVRKVEQPYLLNSQFPFISPSQVLNQNEALDSLFIKFQVFYYFKSENRYFDCFELMNDWRHYCKVPLEENGFALNKHGKYAGDGDKLYYATELQGSHNIAKFDLKTGKREKLIRIINDSLVFECYKRYNGIRTHEAWQQRKNHGFNNLSEFQSGSLCVLDSTIRIGGELTIFFSKEGREFPVDIIIEFDKELNFQRFYLPEKRLFENRYFSMLVFHGNNFFLNDSQYYAAIDCLDRDKSTLQNCIGIFSLRGNTILLTKIIQLHSSFLKYRQVDNWMIFAFKYWSRVSGKDYIFDWIAPYAYDLETGKETPICSNKPLPYRELIEGQDFTKIPFLIRHVQFYEGKLVQIFTEDSRQDYFICIMDNKFQPQLTKYLFLVPDLEKKFTHVEFLNIENGNIRYVVITEDMVYYKELPLKIALK